MGKEKMSAGRHGEEFWAQESKTNIGFKLMKAQGWSQGQGLGKDGAGRTNFIRAKKKDDNLGLGAKQGEDDSWSAMTGLYNEILQRLAVEGGDHLHEDGGVSKVAEPEDTSKTLQDYIVKKRLYGRFRKAKDTCGYSNTDMAAILGKKTETSTSRPTQVATTTVSAVVEKKHEDGSGLTTITSKMSIRDYFSKKMSAGGSKYSAAGGAGFTEEFQERHFNELTRVADGYSGKMGLGLGRSSDPWENDNVSTFNAAAFSRPLIEEKSQVQEEEEKPAKKKKKKDKEQEQPVESEPASKKSKKAKLDASSSSSSSSSDATSSSFPSSSSESTKKSKKSKKETPPVQEEVVQETPKKNKKSKKVTIESVEKKHEEQKEKREKKEKKPKAPRSCAFCSSEDVPMACGRCQKAFYCGEECQTNHWTAHKIKCKLQC